MCVAAFAVLGVLIQANRFDQLNAYAARHLQPVSAGNGHGTMRAAAEAVVAPGAVEACAAIIAVCAWRLWARGRRREAVVWPGALAAAIGLEVVAKLLVQQHSSGVSTGYGLTFDSSFPSGHMLRSLLVTAALAAAWPALRRPLNVWCAAVAVCLIATGWHLPTDIVGGVLAGLALIYLARGAARARRAGPPTVA